MEKLGRDLARAYMAAYNEAMNQTFRPDFAGQVAMMVTVAIANRSQQQQPEDTMAGQIFRMVLQNHANERHDPPKQTDPTPKPAKKPQKRTPKKDPKKDQDPKKDGDQDE